MGAADVRQWSLQEAFEYCARLAVALRVVGHRGDLVLGHASRALAAIDDAKIVTPRHVQQVARTALAHRRTLGDSGSLPEWTAEEDAVVEELLPDNAR